MMGKKTVRASPLAVGPRRTNGDVRTRQITHNFSCVALVGCAPRTLFNFIPIFNKINMEIKMSDRFKKLDRDYDVVWFDKDTYIVARLKEIVKEQIYQRVHRTDNSSNKIIFYETNRPITITAPGISRNIEFKESKWNASTQEIDAKILLGDGSKGWQTGKLRMKVDVTFFPEEYSSFSSSENLKTEIKIDLEFRPDEPIEPQSPLDDLRQREDYKKLQ